MKSILFRLSPCFSIALILLLALFVQPVSADTTVGGTISTDTTWTEAGSPYIVTSNIYVRGTDGPDGITTLAIEPGVLILMNKYATFYVGGSSGYPGALLAQGSAANPIVFTSNEATPAPGDWNGIKFYTTADDATTLMENCVVEYAANNYGTLYLNQASPTFRHVTVQNSKDYGAYIYTSAPTFENCTFNNNQNYDLYYTGTVGGSVTGSTINSGISLLTNGSVSFSDNTINQNNAFPIKTYAENAGGISSSTFNNLDADSYLQVSNSSLITKDATWSAGIAYNLFISPTVRGTDGADGITTLIIEPGAVLKFNSNTGINVGANSGNPGALIAEGTAENQILFTSNKSTPAAGDWYGIIFLNTADDSTSVVRHCVVEYAGYNSWGAVYLDNAAPVVSNCTLRNSAFAGIYVKASSPEITCNTLFSNQYGIYCTINAQPLIHQNNFASNTSYGVYNGSAPTINAEDNWWGDAAGPNTGGDNTYGNVDADPWSSIETNCTTASENQPPNIPSNPLPVDGAVREELSSGAVTVQWAGGDPDLQDTVTYTVYWGESAAGLTLVAQDISENQYTKTGLAEGVTYYWQITAKDNAGLESSGPVWQFTTNGDPPDLFVSHASTIPAGNIQSGQSVTITAEVQNSGSGLIVDPFSVDFRIDGASIGTVAVNQILLSGQSVQVSQSWTYTGGDPTIGVVADDQNQVIETDETNNSFSAMLSEVADNMAPNLVSASPSDGAALQQIQQITVTLADNQGAVDDTAVITSFSVIDTSQQPITGTLTEANDTFTFVPSTLPLVDDTYQVSLNATDVIGNTQNLAFSFTIDTQPPGKPTITGGTVDSGTIQTRPILNTANDFIAHLQGSRDAGTSVWINGVQEVDLSDTNWSVQVLLQPGINTLEVWLLDLAGNQGASEYIDIDMQTGTKINYEYDAGGRTKRIQSGQ